MRITARARLTALYGGLLLVAGGGLVASVYFLMRKSLADRLPTAITLAIPADWAPAVAAKPTQAAEGTESAQGTGPVQGTESVQGTDAVPGMTPEAVRGRAATLGRAATAAEDTAYEQLLIVSLIALAIFAVVSVFLAWWMAGRVLRPVHTITATARRLSGENLDERIALAAPPGELKDLADTFDAMLDRLQGLVSAQQRFVANAAHELRTPLAVQRAALEIGLADPDPARVARVRTKLLDVADRSERLIEGLLLLSASDRGLDRPEPIDAGEMVEGVVAEHAAEARDRDVTVETYIEPVRLEGDPTLFRHLVRNLLENALRYNVPGGRILVHMDDTGLKVRNTGPKVPSDVVPHLFEPFRRLHPRRHARGEGTGLGLSIVDSIARAHGGEAVARANPGGGLSIRVTFGTRGLGTPDQDDCGARSSHAQVSAGSRS
ncbi:sensor histidine kinase [Actinomadura rudentiformis]|uniref:histidine kinase n=1 Tax=Actinomadura rudentiformis TaxID=359158 RepID=A0A6H9YXY6_9ACTN|nr:ATP-binding protein [Actinomadura rudentiformis]KAB2347454.1 HAMP domain-containing protein [Actinomadura rudentiformis]